MPGKPEAEEERHEWQLNPTYCFFRSACNVDEFRPSIVPLQQSVERFFGCECPCVGDLFYPPGSCRSWHTDRYSYVGWAVYLVKVAEADRSSFRYVDPCTGEMVVVPDRNDVACFFRVSAEEPLFWHGRAVRRHVPLEPRVRDSAELAVAHPTRAVEAHPAARHISSPSTGMNR